MFAVLGDGVKHTSADLMTSNTRTHIRSGHTITFKGRLADEAADAKYLLGHIGRGDPAMAACLQAKIDEDLLVVQQSNATFNSLPNDVVVQLPTDLDLEKDFVHPATNRFSSDPLCVNVIPSRDPEVQSDTFFVCVFIFIRKPHDHTPARRVRDRRSQVKRKHHQVSMRVGRPPKPSKRHQVMKMKKGFKGGGLKTTGLSSGNSKGSKSSSVRNMDVDGDDDGDGDSVSTMPALDRVDSGSRGSKRSRETDMNSPRRQQRLDDGSAIEISDEAATAFYDVDEEDSYQYEITDTSEDSSVGPD